MGGDRERGSFEARLAALKAKMEEGLPARARELRERAAGLGAGEPDARDAIRRLAHKLRGTAGSHGHEALGSRAAEVELAANDPSIDAADLARRTLALAEAIDSARPAPRAAPAPAASGPKALAGRRVIAIDDDDATRKLLELTLRSLGGSDAAIVSTPDEALAALERGAYDLVIVDAMMPAMTGLELALLVRGRAPEVPIAFLSAAAQDELGWELPARSAWLRKPFRPRELLERLVALATHGA